MIYNIKLYYHKNILELVSIELNGIKHFIADIRGINSDELYFVLSSSTIENISFNDNNINELISSKYYKLVEKDIDVIINDDIYKYCFIEPKYYKLSQ